MAERTDVLRVSPHEQQSSEETLLSTQTSATRIHAMSQPRTSLRPSILERLPIEILTNIFTLSLSRDHSFVVILAQLSSSLRRIVISTPVLWSTLSLYPHNEPQIKVKIWLSYNKGLLRGLYIRGYSSKLQKAVYALRYISLDKLRALSVRACILRRLLFSLPLLTPTIISNLRSFSLASPSPQWLRGTSNLQLRYLSVYVKIGGSDMERLATQCAHLGVLNWRGAVLSVDSEPGILSLLQRNPHLESFTYMPSKPAAFDSPSEEAYDKPTTAPPRTILLAHLTTLILGSMATEGTSFLSRLSLPNLRHLRLEGRKIDGACVWDDILQHLTTTNAVSQLRSLTVVYPSTGSSSNSITTDSETQRQPGFSAETFVLLLQRANQLGYLELFCVAHVEPVLRALAGTWTGITSPNITSDPGDAPLEATIATTTTTGTETEMTVTAPPPLCPRLQILDLSQCPDVNDELLTDIVKARNSADGDTHVQVGGKHGPPKVHSEDTDTQTDGRNSGVRTVHDGQGNSPNTANTAHTSTPSESLTPLTKLIINSCPQVTNPTLCNLRKYVPRVTCDYQQKERSERIQVSSPHW